MKTSEIELDESKFRDWLSGKLPEEIIAENWSCKDCPIVKWLNDEGYSDVAAYSDGVVRIEKDYLVVKWVSWFIRNIDRFKWNNHQAATAGICLIVLGRGTKK